LLRQQLWLVHPVNLPNEKEAANKGCWRLSLFVVPTYRNVVSRSAELFTETERKHLQHRSPASVSRMTEGFA